MAKLLVTLDKKWGKAMAGEEVEIISESLPAIIVQTKKGLYFTVVEEEIQRYPNEKIKIQTSFNYKNHNG